MKQARRAKPNRPRRTRRKIAPHLEDVELMGLRRSFVSRNLPYPMDLGRDLAPMRLGLWKFVGKPLECRRMSHNLFLQS
jgi:hypothetical protein